MAYTVADFASTHNGAAYPRGYAGGTTYHNDGRDNSQILPQNTTYREYDRHPRPHVSGADRGRERVVLGADVSVWYTYDHYRTMYRLK